MVGRSEPFGDEEVAHDNLGDVRLETYLLQYLETWACIDEKLLKKIAEHYGKKISELDDDDVANYLIDVMKIEEADIDEDHVFTRAW